MIETQIIKEKNQPKFVIMDYKIFERFYDLIEELEDEFDADLDPKNLGPRIPFEIVEAIAHGKGAVAAWREFRGMTQTGLAKKLKMTQAAVSSLERVNANLRKKTLQKLAKALQCPVEALVV